MRYIKYLMLTTGFGASLTLLLMGLKCSAINISILTLGFCVVSWLMEKE